jgi:phage shock protein A
MGFFGRLANLWRGFTSLWIKNVEAEHPEIAYENSINSMVEKYNALKTATASIISRRNDIDARLKDAQKNLDQVNGDLETAVDSGRDDLAVILIKKQEKLEAEIADLTAQLKQAADDADSAKSSLQEVQAKIQELKDEKDRNLAKMASAKARIQVQEQLEGLSVDDDMKALDSVRENIKNLEAKAQLNKELKDGDLDSQLAALRKDSVDVSAKAKLEAMKAARAAKAAQKTM